MSVQQEAEQAWDALCDRAYKELWDRRTTVLETVRWLRRHPFRATGGLMRNKDFFWSWVFMCVVGMAIGLAIGHSILLALMLVGVVSLAAATELDIPEPKPRPRKLRSWDEVLADLDLARSEPQEEKG